MNTTTNYNLKKPESTDFYDIQNENDNMDALDTLIKSLHDDLDTLSTSVSSQIQALATRVSGAESSISTLEGKVEDLEEISQYDRSSRRIAGDDANADCYCVVKNGVAHVTFSGGAAFFDTNPKSGTWHANSGQSVPAPSGAIVAVGADVSRNAFGSAEMKFSSSAMRIEFAGMTPGMTYAFVYPVTRIV